jgi:hypothetical protein
MPLLFEITEGWTGALGPFTLSAQLPGASVATPFNLTGYTVTLEMREGATNRTVAGTTTQRDQSTYPGQVMFAPAATDFTVGASGMKTTYTFRWRVIDSQGKTVFFPNGAADIVIVHRE